MFWWLKKRLHRSWVIVWLVVGIILGVVVAFCLRIAIFGSLTWLFIAGLIIILAMWRPRLWMMILVFAAGFLIGVFRTSFVIVDLDYVRQLAGRNVMVVGTVYDDPDMDESGKLTLRVNNLRVNEQVVNGSLYIQVSGEMEMMRSDEVVIGGVMNEGFGSFNGAMFGAIVKEINRPEPGDVALKVRNWFADLVRRFIPEPEVDLSLGYLLGQRRNLPAAMMEVLTLTGLTHIIVASGYNLTVLVRLARRVFKRVSRFAAVFAAGLLILGFIAITGASPSMVRAGLVAGLSLIAWYDGRKFHPVKLLLLVAAATLLINPSYIVDLGWLLSFGAFAGVMILASLIMAYFYDGEKKKALQGLALKKEEKPNFLVQVLIETVAAQLLTLPLIMYFFGQFSVVSFAANALILPLIPAVMLLTFCTGALAWWPFLAGVTGWAAMWILRYQLAVMNWFAELPWAVREASMGIGGVAICYAVILGMGIYLRKATGYKLAQASVIE